MKKYLLPPALLLLIAVLVGCSGSESSAPPDEAQFIGFLVTFEKLDGETEAQLVGDEYIFDVGDSVNFYVPSVRYGEGELDYLVGLCDSTVSDVSLEVGEVVRASGTQYITAELNDKTVWPNEVYQSGDRVWAEPVSGLIIAGGVTVRYPSEDPQYSLKFAVVPTPVRLYINQMNAEHTLLQTDEYPIDELPDRFTPLDETDYIVFDVLNDDGGYSVYLRQRTNAEDSTFLMQYHVASGLCADYVLEIDW